MVKQNSEKTSAKKAEKKTVKEEKIEEEKVECQNCKYLDTRTIRDFHRDGIRKGLVERRGKCTNEKVKACHHLVRIDMPKKCTGFEEGKFKIPQKEKNAKEKKETAKEKELNKEEMTSPAQYFGPDLSNVEKAELERNKKKHSKKQRLKNGEKIIVKDPHNEDVKTFEQQGHRLVLVKQ